MRVPGGAPLAWVWGVRGRALPQPRLPALWAGCRGPLPTGCWCGGCAGVGTRHQPHSARSFELALRAVGAARGRPGGGASCLGMGRPGLGAPPPPTARPLGGLPGPTTDWLWVRGGAGVGTRHQPHSARSFELALRAVGAARGRSGGGRLLPGCGASKVGRSPIPDCPPSARAAGAHYPRAVGAGGCGRGDPSPTPQHALWRADFARCGGGTRAPLEGRLLPGCGASGVGCSPTHDCQPSWRAAGAHYPLAVGAGGCGRGDPSPTPQRALLRAGFARCGGGMWVPGGGRLLHGCGQSRGRALPQPRLPALWAGCRGPLPTGCGCGGGAGVGTRHQPHSARSCELALRAVGAARGRPGGAPLAWVWGVRGRALSHPRLHALWAGCRGPLPTGCGCGGVRAWGPVSNPTARALACSLCALWGRHESARGGRLLPGCGASGVGRSPTPDCTPSGRAAGAHYPLAVGAGGCGGGDLSPTPQRALLRASFARCGGGPRAPGGGRLLPGCGASGVGRSPTPDCPPSGRAAGAHYPLAVGAGGCGRGDPSANRQRAPLRAGFARCGGGTRVPGGDASCLGVGRPGSGALPPPTARPLGGLPGPTTHWLCVRGGAGLGTCHQPHSARSCELALRAVGAARGRPGGGAPLAWVWGVPGWAHSQPRLPALWAGCRGSLPTGCGHGGMRAWGPVTNPTARALASWLCVL